MFALKAVMTDDSILGKANMLCVVRSASWTNRRIKRVDQGGVIGAS